MEKRKNNKNLFRFLFLLIGISLGSVIGIQFYKGAKPKEQPKPVVDAIDHVATGDDAETVPSSNKMVRFIAEASLDRFEALSKLLIKDGFQPVDFEFLQVEDQTSVSAIFRKLEQPEVTRWKLGMSESDLQTYLESPELDGYFPIDFEAYRLGEKNWFALIHRKQDQETKLIRKMDESQLDMETKNERQSPIDFDVESTLENRQYALIVEVQNENSDSKDTRNAFQKELNMVQFDQVDLRLRSKRYTNRMIEPYNLAGGDTRFAGIWSSPFVGDRTLDDVVKGESQTVHRASPSTQRTLLDLVSLLETDRELSKEGYILSDLGTAYLDGEVIYSAVWIHRASGRAPK